MPDPKEQPIESYQIGMVYFLVVRKTVFCLMDTISYFDALCPRGNAFMFLIVLLRDFYTERIPL